ncbi:MAG: poly-gamma-glutamate biosynthesis protein [Deltaproteobacteria bacterium SG8_13]|nr:MAG: poly-gamma-glutamate biosynthesis protein [Deltaproteobacteria bacterium SG8_13]
MTGRGIDQVLPHPGSAVIHEDFMKSARGYVEIAERANGRIKTPVCFSYVWGDALKELDRKAPDVRIVNLETSVTASSDYWKNKGIHYRMHPDNTPVLTAAKIDVCALANNHVLDWGYAGLVDTLAALHGAGIQTAGAGISCREARTAAVKPVPGKGRVVVLAFGLRSSGIPSDWGAGDKKPGVCLLEDLSDRSLGDIQRQVAQVKRNGDVVVASIHWGSNWGHRIARAQRDFAHQLIEAAGVDIVHGHSSHHVRAIEVYRDKLILYGCGDFLNDYEGIGGYEQYRGDLSLMYFATVAPATGRLLALEMTPTTIRRFRIVRASGADTLWLKDTLNRQGAVVGTRVAIAGDNRLTLKWD